MTRLLCRIALAFAMPGARVRWVERPHTLQRGLICQILPPAPHPMAEGWGATPLAAFRDAMGKLL